MSEMNPPSPVPSNNAANLDTLRTTVSMAIAGAIIAGALDIVSSVLDLIQGKQEGFGWPEWLAVGSLLASMLVLSAFWELGEHFSRKALRVSVLGVYLCLWSGTVAIFSTYEGLPTWATITLSILAVLMVIGVLVEIGEAYRSIGQALIGIKFVVVISIAAAFEPKAERTK